MSKYKFRGREIIYSVAITCMTIPIVGSMASAFKLYMNLGVYDTPWFVVITSIGGFGGTFLIYYGYFKNISWSYAEAAMMDGAGPYTIFFKVMLPQAAPLLMTYMITGAMGSWGDYMSFVTYMPSWPNLGHGALRVSVGYHQNGELPRVLRRYASYDDSVHYTFLHEFG